MPATAAKTEIQIPVQQNWSNRSEQTGFLSEFKNNQLVLNSAQFASQLQSEKELDLQKLIEKHSKGVRRIMTIFNQRFAENQEIFSEIESKMVVNTTKSMAELLQFFQPEKHSVDVTFDQSVMLQAHFGSLHIFWESFFEPTSSQIESTLNVYFQKKLMLTSGGEFQKISKEFIDFAIRNLPNPIEK
jgi:hypothetical protein